MQKNRERNGKVTEVNKAKEYLLQVSRAEHRIKRLKEEILTLQDRGSHTGWGKSRGYGSNFQGKQWGMQRNTV